MKRPPVTVVCYGDYYCGCAGRGVRAMSLRRLCHRVKATAPHRWGRRLTRLVEAAVRGLAARLPADAAVVPVPTSSVPYTDSLAEMLAEFLGRAAVVHALRREQRRETIYDLKKRGVTVREEDTGIVAGTDADYGAALRGRPVVLIDNVIATGTTMSAALGVLEGMGIDRKDVICAAIACDSAVFSEK